MDKAKVESLIADTERLRADFMKADLKLGLTFANIARTEADSGEMPHATQSIGRASRAAEIVGKLLAQTTMLGQQERKQMEAGLKKLNAVLAELGQTVRYR